MNFRCSKVAMILTSQKLKVTPNVKEPHEPQHFLGTEFSRRPFSKIAKNRSCKALFGCQE